MNGTSVTNADAGAAPLVSVILATYRRGHVIGRALRSVLTQSFRDFEVLVLDDVPGDSTEAVVRSFNDPRLRYIAYPDRRGVAAARNQGIALARGKYLAFQDSDDEWLADKLRLQVERLESRPDVALTQAAVLRYDKLGADYWLSDLPPGRADAEILRCNMTTFTQGWLARKDAVVAAGAFDERMPLWEDWDLMIRICQRDAIDIDPRPMAMVYDTPGGLTAQDAARVPTFCLILEKYADLMARHRPILAFNLYTVARMEVGNGNTRAALPYLFRSLRTDPRLLRSWALLIAAFAGKRVVDWIAQLRRRWRRESVARGGAS